MISARIPNMVCVGHLWFARGEDPSLSRYQQLGRPGLHESSAWLLSQHTLLGLGFI